jgi:P27 family predicted phage terminase small subunit
MRGRKPKPRALKLLAGNPGKRYLGDEPNVPPLETAAPAVLGAEGKREWARIARLLGPAGIVREPDAQALTLLCSAWERWVDAEAQVAATGGAVVEEEAYDGVRLRRNEWRRTADEAWDRVLKALIEFGATPAARARLKTGDGTPADALGDFLARRPKTG